MFILMTIKQFEEFKQKAGGKDAKDAKGSTSKEGKDDKGTEGSEGEKDLRGKTSKDKSKQEGLKVSIKEDDDTHGTLEFEDANIGYFYNAAEGRLYLGPVTDRKTLAGFIASDTSIGEYLMYKLAQVEAPQSTTTGPKPPAPPNGEKDQKAGEGEDPSKKDQTQNNENQANQSQ